MDKFIQCDLSHLSEEQLMKALSAKTTVGGDEVEGVRCVIVNATECDNVTDAVDCDLPHLNKNQLFRNKIVLDPCDKPALLLINTANAS
jgi:hypothetical protein